ncbi:MAG: hypothetical protein AB1390_09960 [Nitrospirota bacterium]
MEISLKLSDYFCPNESCDDHGKRGLGNIVVYHKYGKNQRRLLRCRTCNLKFSERRSTIFFGFHTKESKIKEVILHLLDGMSFREAATASSLDKDTVQRIWKRFLSYCEETMGNLLEEFNIKLEDLIILLHRRIQKRVKRNG